MVRGRVEVRLAEDDHPDVGVQVDLPGLGAAEPGKSIKILLVNQRFSLWGWFLVRTLGERGI